MGTVDDGSLVKTKETAISDQIKELAHTNKELAQTIQEMKVMIESMSKKHK
jgi:hypothetical protein